MLLNKLYEYRTAEAHKRGIPPYCVFSNKIAQSTIDAAPKTVEMLACIKGWGPKTIDNYGLDILSIIANPDDPIPEGGEFVPPPKREVPKSEEITLNEEQTIAYDLIASGNSILLSGEAGTGKTEVIKRFHRDFSKKKKIALTSTTGTSALLIGGSTIHSFLGIGLGKGTIDYMVTSIGGRDYLRKRWRELDVLVIDEISMLDPRLFDKLDEVGRIIRNRRNEPWGGIQLILSGDFLQLPVVGSDQFTFEASSWGTSVSKTIVLTNNVRQAGDGVWMSILSDIRVGVVSTETKCNLEKRVGVVVGGDGIIPTKLYSRNMDVDRVNEEALDVLASNDPDLVFNEYEMTTMKMVKKQINESVISGYKGRCIAAEVLQLCVGAQVMLVINKSDVHLSNGSRGVVECFSPDSLPMVRFTNGVFIEIPRHNFEVNAADGTTELLLNQLPLKIAYALSIHKSQGITLDCAEIDIRSCFCDGQAYVALSRVRALDGLSLVGGFDVGSVKANEKCIAFYNTV